MAIDSSNNVVLTSSSGGTGGTIGAAEDGSYADGLFADLEKLINKQKLSFKLNLNNVPISKNLNKLLIQKKLDKISFISKGDDYQILFTANSSKSRIINKTAKSLGIKISKIGKICSSLQKSQFIDKKGNKIAIKDKGYSHQF